MKDIYVKFVGASELQGDSTDTKHMNEIEVNSYSHSVFQPKSSSASSAGGHTAERTEHGEMLFTKDIDKATAKLLRGCSAGTVYPQVDVVAYRSYGGTSSTSTSQSRVPFWKITMKNVVVSSVSTTIGAGELPTETFGLKYSEIIWEYMQHKIDGTSASTGRAGWDLAKNVARG
jgi:type VI secretion system secreted protein Hcp